MGEPVKVVASMESIRLPNLGNKPEEAWPTQPIISGDPLSAFEHYDWHIKTELSGWMTFSPEDRLKKARVFVNSKKIDVDKKTKILNFIIWIESHHKLGRREPAAVAFNALFPKEKPDASA